MRNEKSDVSQSVKKKFPSPDAQALASTQVLNAVESHEAAKFNSLAHRARKERRFIPSPVRAAQLFRPYRAWNDNRISAPTRCVGLLNYALSELKTLSNLCKYQTLCSLANRKSFQIPQKLLLSCVIIFLLSLCAGCTTGSKARTTNERDSSSFAKNNPSRSIEVNAVEVKQTTSSGPILIPASITVEDVAEVLSQRNGVVVQIYAQEGQRVKKGEVLVQLSNDDLQSQLQQATLEVSRLKVEEKQFLAAVNLNRTELEREKVLFKENVSSQSDVERAQYRLDQATQEYEKIRIATQTAQARVDAVKIEIEKIKIRAPIDGVIIKRQVSLGSSVTANQKLFELSRLAPLKVKFQLPQTSGARLNVGETISLSSVSSNQIIASARISRISPVADATNYTFGYVADVVGGNGLMPGVAVNVNILPSSGVSVVYVPLAAFPRGFELQANSTATLLVIENNRCVERTVTVQGTDGDQAIVSSGLLGGDKVVIAAPPNLKTGDAVTVK